MGQTTRKPKKHNIVQDVTAAEGRIAARLRELAEKRAGLDRELLTVAAQKRVSGTAATVREANALGKYEGFGAEQQWWQLARRLPQQFLRIISGRQTKQINEQAQRYGLSIGGKTWDLAAFVLEVFGLLARIAPWYGQLEGSNGDAALLVGPSTPTMERLRLAKAKLLELQLDERTRAVLPRGDVREAFNDLAGFLREAGQRIGREHGRAAQQILEHALQEFPRKAAKLLRRGEQLPAAKTARAGK